MLEELLEAIDQQKEAINRQKQQLADNKALLLSDAVLDADAVSEQLAVVKQQQEKLGDDLRELEKLRKKIDSQISDIQAELNDEEKNAEYNELQNRMRAATEKLEDLQKTNRLIYEPADGTNSDSWIIQVGGKVTFAAKMKVNRPPLKFKTSQEIQTWLEEQKPAFTLVLIKPDGLEVFLPFDMR